MRVRFAIAAVVIAAAAVLYMSSTGRADGPPTQNFVCCQDLSGACLSRPDYIGCGEGEYPVECPCKKPGTRAD